MRVEKFINLNFSLYRKIFVFFVFFPIFPSMKIVVREINVAIITSRVNNNSNRFIRVISISTDISKLKLIVSLSCCVVPTHFNRISVFLWQ